MKIEIQEIGEIRAVNGKFIKVDIFATHRQYIDIFMSIWDEFGDEDLIQLFKDEGYVLEKKK